MANALEPHAAGEEGEASPPAPTGGIGCLHPRGTAPGRISLARCYVAITTRGKPGGRHCSVTYCGSSEKAASCLYRKPHGLPVSQLNISISLNEREMHS